MTGAEILTNIKLRSANRTSTTLSDDWYIARMNEGYRYLATYQERAQNGDVERSIRFHELFKGRQTAVSASPSSSFITGATDMYSMISLYDLTNTRPVDHKPLRTIYEQDDSLTGRIIMWTQTSNGAVLGYRIWKKPTAATSLQEIYYAYPAALADDTTAPIIPAHWHMGIEIAGAMRVARLLRLRDHSKDLRMEFEELLSTSELPFDRDNTGGRRTFSIGVPR